MEPPHATGPLGKDFTAPPFTVFDGRSGWWRQRKRAWLSLGIRGEIGRDTNVYNTAKGGGFITQRTSVGISVFDPVLCEIVYKWFCPPGGQVVDPFAGGSVRGIVAAAMGYRYWGCELRAEQVAANRQQATDIKTPQSPVWVCGDSTTELANAPAADLIFTCPPYGNLERYSSNPHDLSNMDWPQFVAAYRRIIAKAIDKLKQHSFAVIVVANFRDPATGFYRPLVAETISAFTATSAGFYNDAILITPAGTAPIRAPKQFRKSRKLVKIHQNVLVFCKGNPIIATRKIRQT